MPQPTPAADLELSLWRADKQTVSAEVRFRDPASGADSELAARVPVRLDHRALAQCNLDPQTYGRTLTQMLFADERLRLAWQRARSYVHGANTTLRFRLRLDQGTDALHRLRWETLQAPDAGTPLCMSERVIFSRYLGSPDLAPIIIPRGSSVARFALRSPPRAERIPLPPRRGSVLRAGLRCGPMTCAGLRCGPTRWPPLRADTLLPLRADTLACAAGRHAASAAGRHAGRPLHRCLL